MFELKNKQIKNKIYNIKSFVEEDKIVIEIETGLSKYSNKYDFEYLQKFRFFRMSDDLEEAFEDLKSLFSEEYSIEEKGNNLELIFHFRRSTINFMLNLIDDSMDISYDNLSPQMKKIIDNNELILGIDLGTTYSCASVMIDKNIIMIRNSFGSTIIPSCLTFVNNNEVCIGEFSKLMTSSGKNNIYDLKKLIGKNIDKNQIKEISSELPFNLIKDNKTNLLKIVLNFQEKHNEQKYLNDIKNDNKELYPEELYSLLLKKIIKDSEFYLSKKIGKKIKINNSVITIPGYFNQNQREATLNSAKLIGLNIESILNESSAICLSYAYNNYWKESKYILVIDFGAVALNLTLLKYQKDEKGIYIYPLKTFTDTNLGGQDFDKILMNKIKELYSTNLKNLQENQINQRLKKACERAKIKLSTLEQTRIYLNIDEEDITLDCLIKKKDFINYCKELFDKLENIINDFIAKTDLDIKNISEVILAGNSTKIPKIKEIISNKFKNSRITCNLNPKEVVAMGAAIKGSTFCGLISMKEINLFDITNLSIGIKEKDNKFNTIIEKNERIPCGKKHIFKTLSDNQTSIIIDLYEIENLNNKENNLIASQYEIDGLPKKKAGEVSIEVKFEINDNSILEVKAKEKNKSLNNNLKITKLNELDIQSLESNINQITLYEDKEYNKIKFSIIELEEKIIKQKTQFEFNDECFRFLNNNILDKILKFLEGTQEYSNSFIIFSRYYISKIYDIFRFKINNNDDTCSRYKENLFIILDKITLVNSKIINEISGEFADCETIYKIFFDFILKIYYEKVNLIFYSTKSESKKKNNINYENILSEINEAMKLIDKCIIIINRFNLSVNNITNLNLKDLENFKLKLKVKEQIIKIKDASFLKKIFPYNKDNLTKLYDQYFLSEAYDIDDLKELGLLAGKKYLKEDYDNFEHEFQKAINFNEWINLKKNNFNISDISNIIERILIEYPYCEKKDEDEMWDNFDLFKSKQMNANRYILLIRGKYQKLFNDDDTNDVKKQVYNNILIFLNSL